MRKGLATMACFALSLFVHDTAHLQSRYAYIAEATNRLLALSAEGSRIEPREAAAAVKQACDALGILLKDQQFYADLQAWSKDQRLKDRLAFKRDLDLFLDAFLMPEKAVLRNAGFDTNATERLLMSAAAVHASIDMKLDQAAVIKNIELLRAHICDTASRVEGMTQQQELRQLIRRWAAGFAGVGLIVADLPLVGGGPTAAVAATSGVAGGILLDRAIGDLNLR